MTEANPNRAFTLRDGKIQQEVDAIRLAVGDRPFDKPDGSPILRKSGVWKFRTAKNGTHFFLTSSGLQSEMKGTVHLTEAHFGLNEHVEETSDSWIGPIPSSRHFHTLRIRELAEGEYQHVFGIAIPGFALMETPQAFDRGKIVTWSDPHPFDTEVTFGLTVVQGDWRQFLGTESPSTFIGLLTGDADRHALVSFTLNKYPDVSAAIANMQRNLGLIGLGNRQLPIEELSTIFWMDREVDDPIKIIELNSVRHAKPNS